MSKKKRSSGLRSFVVIIIIAALAFGAYKGYQLYETYFAPNTITELPAKAYIYVKTGASFDDVIEAVRESNTIKDIAKFKTVAQQQNLAKNIHPGKYKVTTGMSNTQLIALLISGKQTPVNLTFSSVRSINRLARIVSHQLEADSAEIVALTQDSLYLSQYEFTPRTAMAMFIPNTYQFYWNTTAEEFVRKMHQEYTKFWNNERRAKLQRTSLTPIKVSILASIIENETNQNDEKPLIAGVYLNRLRKGMALQADPTIKFVMNDWGIKRVLREYLTVDSPYNTYKYAGLPPGPITIPSIASIDAVLDFEPSDYLYFCAAPGTGGYHAFSKTFDQHKSNALTYRRSLNKRGIKK